MRRGQSKTLVNIETERESSKKVKLVLIRKCKVAMKVVTDGNVGVSLQNVYCSHVCWWQENLGKCGVVVQVKLWG